MIDLGDQLLSPDLHDQLGIGGVETRQCLSLHPALATVLGGRRASDAVWKTVAHNRKHAPAAPGLREGELERAKAAAVLIRASLWQGAVDALAHLGDPPPWAPSAESLIRSYAHDCIRAHHEKDYRCLQAFPCDVLSNVTLMILRVNHWGKLEADILRGPEAQDHHWACCVVHKGHMRTGLHSEGSSGWQKLYTILKHNGKISRETESVGWGALLNDEEGSSMVPSKPPSCPRCTELEAETGKVGEAPPAPPPSLTEVQVIDVTSAAGTPLKSRPAFAWGPRGKELWGGWGGWSKGLQYQGIPTEEPVELFEDPLHLTGPRPAHDLRTKEVRQALLQEASAMPGPEAPNVWQLACSCKSSATSC